jgi:MHS family proline/betaine transporter-like MFS transporter
MNAQESPEFIIAEEKARQGDVEGVSGNPLKEVAARYWKQMVAGGLAVASWTAGGYVTLLYLPTYFTGVLHRSSREGLAVALAGLVAYVACIPVAGRLSDIFPRWKVMTAGAVLTAVAAVPCFLLLSRGNAYTAAIAAVAFAARTPASVEE